MHLGIALHRYAHAPSAHEYLEREWAVDRWTWYASAVKPSASRAARWSAARPFHQVPPLFTLKRVSPIYFRTVRTSLAGLYGQKPTACCICRPTRRPSQRERLTHGGTLRAVAFSPSDVFGRHHFRLHLVVDLGTSVRRRDLSTSDSDVESSLAEAVLKKSAHLIHSDLRRSRPAALMGIALPTQRAM